ncbi:MAG: DUF2703 domain-containing protein [Candidatus Natronoplasma sp.]
MEKGCCEKEDRLVIDLLYVDISECERCRSSDETLDRTVRELRDQIHGGGVSTITVNKTKITSDEEAESRGVKRSPTLRINGKDIEEIVNEEYEVKDSYCPSCEDVTDPECSEVTRGGNDCRVFGYEGETYETIPEEMIEEAVAKTIGIEFTGSSSCCEAKKSCC